MSETASQENPRPTLMLQQERAARTTQEAIAARKNVMVHKLGERVMKGGDFDQFGDYHLDTAGAPGSGEMTYTPAGGAVPDILSMRKFENGEKKQSLLMTGGEVTPGSIAEIRNEVAKATLAQT